MAHRVGRGSLRRTWRQFRALDAGRRALVLEAAVLLAVLPVALRLAAFGRVRRGLEAYADLKHQGGASPALVGWAVRAAAARFSAGRNCLVCALTADAILRRRGHASRLQLGIRRAEALPLDGHAWVECEGVVVVGELDELPTYRRLSLIESGS